MSSQRSESEACSSGDSARSSWMKSPSSFFLFADRLLERDRMLSHMQDVLHLRSRHLELPPRSRRAAARDPGAGRALDVDDLVQLLDHVDGDADRPYLVGDGDAIGASYRTLFGRRAPPHD